MVFQFPPNGKARVNSRWNKQAVLRTTVSIPSEREGTCEPAVACDLEPNSNKFRFPPNGKARVNVLKNTQSVPTSCQFRFPPNGKARVNTQLLGINGLSYLAFRFPPNGKARVNTRQSIFYSSVAEKVSIPSEREGTCELDMRDEGTWSYFLSFHSLRTGRHV